MSCLSPLPPVPWQVLGYYNRRGINPEAFLNEIKYIASDPDDKHFFNVTDEAALKDIVDALGDRIFSLEGEHRFLRGALGPGLLAGEAHVREIQPRRDFPDRPVVKTSPSNAGFHP